MSAPAVNPFTGTPAPTMNIPVPAFLKDWGFALQEAMLGAARAVQDGEGGGAGMTAFALAVLFGVVHIIGPGHGKLFTIGYFGSRRAKLSEGLKLSALVNILDSLSALLLVGVAYGILSVSLRAAGASAGQITRLIAYGAVTILGASHLIGHLRHSHSHSHSHGHCGHGCLQGEGGAQASGQSKIAVQAERQPQASEQVAQASEQVAQAQRHPQASTQPQAQRQEGARKQMKPWMLAVSVGLIPCPVSSAILSWGIVNNALPFAALLVLGVSIGGMIAMTAFSFALIGGKAGVTQLLERKGLLRALEIVEISALVFLCVVGLLLFLSAL